jgi:hypothetical protein
MAALSYSDLVKPFPARHPDHPKLRYTKLVSMIEGGELFEMNSGLKKQLTYANPTVEKNLKAGNISALKGNQSIFKDLKTKASVRLDAIKKTKEFGGGGGSGAGADVTKLAESAQCLYCALAFWIFKRKLALDEPITVKQFQEAAKYIDTDETLDNMINNLPDEWIRSSILGANKLYEKYNSVKMTKMFKFHRGSSFVNSIEGEFKRINKTERAFGDLNKWSPADIYIVGSGANLEKLQKNETLKGLNNEMLKQYMSNELIGVSLKKMVATARFSELNVGTKGAPTKGAQGKVGFKGYTVKANETSEVFDSMDIYIQWGESAKERIQFRSFGTGDGLTGWQGELKGETANQGKISLGPANYILRQHAGEDLPASADVAKRVRDGDESILVEIYENSKLLGVRNLDTQSDFLKRARAMDMRWKYSKYLGTKLLALILKQPIDVRNNIVYDFYSYAGSKSRFAAPYAKVEG